VNAPISSTSTRARRSSRKPDIGRRARDARKSRRTPSRLESSAIPLCSPSSRAARIASTFASSVAPASPPKLSMSSWAMRARCAGESVRASSRIRAASAIRGFYPARTRRATRHTLGVRWNTRPNRPSAHIRCSNQGPRCGEPVNQTRGPRPIL
jgi:hypothetical protein